MNAWVECHRLLGQKPACVRIDEFISAICVLKISRTKFLIKVSVMKKMDLFQFLNGASYDCKV